MLPGYAFIEVRPSGDGFDVRVPRGGFYDDAPDYIELSDDIQRFAEVAHGTVRLDLTATEWISGAVAGRVITLFRAIRDRGRLVLIVNAFAADFFRITRLNRLLVVWATHRDLILTRV